MNKSYEYVLEKTREKKCVNIYIYIYEYVLEKTREKKCVNIYIYIYIYKYINTLTDFAKSYVLFVSI